MNWLGQGTVLMCSGRVQAPTGTVAACPPPCAPLLLLFLVVTSFSGACLLELLCHPAIWDCTACPMLVLVLAGSLRTSPGCPAAGRPQQMLSLLGK